MPGIKNLQEWCNPYLVYDIDKGSANVGHMIRRSNLIAI